MTMQLFLVLLLLATFNGVVNVSSQKVVTLDKLKYDLPAPLPITNHTNVDQVFFLPSMLHNGNEILLRFPYLLPMDFQQIHTLCDEGNGEDHICLRSWNEMFEFSKTKLKHYTSPLQTQTINKQEDTTIEQWYTVEDRVEMLKARGGSSPSTVVVCHFLSNTIHYCHFNNNTQVYRVPLEGQSDGTVIQAMAACHLDTSKWNPHHLAFHQVKVKPGESAICHFLVKNEYVWVSIPTVMI